MNLYVGYTYLMISLNCYPVCLFLNVYNTSQAGIDGAASSIRLFQVISLTADLSFVRWYLSLAIGQAAKSRKSPN